MKMKSFINKITTWLCVLVVLFGVFGNSVNVKAAINYKFCIPLDLVRSYNYYTLVEWKDGELRLFLSDTPLTYTADGKGYGSEYFITYWTTDGYKWTKGSGTDTGTTNLKTDGVIGTTLIRWNVFIENASSSMLSEVGYLKDVGVQAVSVGDDTEYKFTFSPTSTTGETIGSGAYKIRVYGKLAYYNKSTGELMQEGENSVIVGDYIISANSIRLSVQDVYNAVAGIEDGLMTDEEMALANVVRGDTIYLQIYNANNYNYGGYVRYRNTRHTIGKDSPIVNINPDGSVDESSNGGGNGSGSGSGSGGLFDTPILDMSGFDSFTSVLDSLMSTLGSVSNAFDTIFGFLPPYCRALFGLSISAMLLIGLVKFIRG